MTTSATETLVERLRRFHACNEGVKWASQFATAAEAWAGCDHSEWMLWGLAKIGYADEAKLRQFACWCVRFTPIPGGRTTWDLLTDECSRHAVETAERFASGLATREELDAAWDVAWDTTLATARDAAWDAAGAAARSAAWDAAGAAGRSAAWAAARDAAGDAAWAAARAAAWAAAWKAQAHALRAIVGNPFEEGDTR